MSNPIYEMEMKLDQYKQLLKSAYSEVDSLKELVRQKDEALERFNLSDSVWDGLKKRADAETYCGHQVGSFRKIKEALSATLKDNK